jgi:DNA-binding MarR family transcriptional regulator
VASPADLLTALRHFGLEDDRFDAIVARRFDAAPAEFKAMDHILASGGLTPGQLGDRLALTSGAVTALVDRLERLGWVKRVPHPGEQIYGQFAKSLARAAAELTPDERAACVRFLDAAAEIAAEQARELTGSGPVPTG